MPKKVKQKSAERIALDAFDAKHTGDLTPEQQGKRDKLEETMRAADFIRIAEKKANSIVRQVGQLTKMAQGSRYVYKDAQIGVMKKAFQESLEACFAAFAGKAVQQGGVKLS